MIEKQSIINYSSKSYASVVFSDSKVAFLGEEKDVIFCLFLCFVYELHCIIGSLLSKFRDYFVEACCFFCQFFEYCIKFFFLKQSYFDVLLTLDFDRISGVSEQIFEMLFHLGSLSS